MIRRPPRSTQSRSSAASDVYKRQSPGDALTQVFRMCSPCLVLIDEWVAYARQLYSRDDLPGGSFDTHFTFAQTLTEAARAVPGALVVVSIPARHVRPR